MRDLVIEAREADEIEPDELKMRSGENARKPDSRITDGHVRAHVPLMIWLLDNISQPTAKYYRKATVSPESRVVIPAEQAISSASAT